MLIFDPYQARYYCELPTVPPPGQVQSLVALQESLPKSVSRLTEGGGHFEAHRASAVFAIERWFLFGVAQYRRALDMFIPSGAPWAQVTLYYSSFYAANALLAMFGIWVKDEYLVEVENGVQGHQVLRINRKAKSPSGVRGSHQRFWDFFYEACTQLAGWVPAEFSTVIQPVNADRSWQIKERNSVNYDTLHAYDAAIRFQSSFNVQKFRASLTGPLLQQLELTEGLLKLTLHYINELHVPHFALTGFNVQGARSRVMKNLVTAAAPNLVTKSELNSLLP